MSSNLTHVNRMSEFSDYEIDKELTHSKMHYKSILNIAENRNIILNTISIPNKYIFFIEKHTYEYEMSDFEYENYRFQPKKFCMDKYDDVELWSLLLKVNHMTSITEFDSKKIRIFYENILETLNEMIIMEQDNIDRNNTRISEAIDKIVMS